MSMTLGLYIFARIAGLFLISPLLGNQMFTRSVRLVLTIFVTLILSLVLYPKYALHADQITALTSGGDSTPSLLILCFLVKEAFIGYLIGFVFLLIYEALLLAGQSIGVMMGLSLNDTLTQTPLDASQPLIAKLYCITASLLFILLDLHHDFLRLTAESFLTVPLGQYHINEQVIGIITQGSAIFFRQALQFAAIPLVVLTLATLSLGLVGRVMPEFNVFLFAFPLKIFLGFYVLMITIHYFPLLLREAFIESYNLATLLLRSLN